MKDCGWHDKDYLLQDQKSCVPATCGIIFTLSYPCNYGCYMQVNLVIEGYSRLHS